MSECEKCKIWQKAAEELGKRGGICQECFDKYFVHFKAIYDPYENFKKKQPVSEK